MVDIHKVIGKVLFKPKKALFYQSTATQALSIHYTYYWETSHIMLLTLLLYAMTFAIQIIQLVNMNVIVKC